MAEPDPAPRFDLDEDQNVPVPGDDVDLSETAAEPPIHDPQSGPDEGARGGLLAFPTETLAWIGWAFHGLHP
jgi:hypothetical protein